MERQPSTYANRQEEDLRDFLLMTLCTHYPNTTGETFNKAGKTDILVRHEGKNVFVGECKFWSGIKAFHDSINQILGYLTWRDSKAAIVCFVKNREINPVLQQVLADRENDVLQGRPAGVLLQAEDLGDGRVHDPIEEIDCRR